MITFSNFKLQPGMGVRITSKEGVILGKFHKIASDETRIQIAEPQGLDGRSLGKLKWIFQGDVLDMKVQSAGDSGYEGGSAPNLALESSMFKPSITRPQRARIERMVENGVLVEQMDSRYQEILRELAEEYFIGIHAENSGMGRIMQGEFLQLSTSSKIYVFDLRLLNAQRLFNDLRPILEGKNCTKVSFDCRFLHDNISSHFGLRMAPVCDLMVILSLEHKTKYDNIWQCVSETLGINFATEQSESLLRRPVTLDQLLALSSKVAFLIPLFHQANQFKLMEKYGDALKEYAAIDDANLYKEIFSTNNKKLKDVLNKFKAL